MAPFNFIPIANIQPTDPVRLVHLGSRWSDGVMAGRGNGVIQLNKN